MQRITVTGHENDKIRAMGSRSAAPLPTQLQADDAVREHLERILTSPTFQQGDRLKRFLMFIVLEAVAGRRYELSPITATIVVSGISGGASAKRSCTISRDFRRCASWRPTSLA